MKVREGGGGEYKREGKGMKLVQKTLEKEFTRVYGALSSSVTGMSEAIDQIKNSKTGNWGTSIEIEGDFGDLYSNCNKTFLKIVL